MRDPIGKYREAAQELTQVTRSAADKLLGGLLRRGESATGNAQELVDEIRERSQENREAVAAMVRAETRRVVNAMGLATAADVERLEREIADLRRQLRDQSGAGSSAASGATSSRSARSGGPTSRASATAGSTASPAAVAASAGTNDREKERGTRQTAKKTAARKTAKKAAGANVQAPALGDKEAPAAVMPAETPSSGPTAVPSAEGVSPEIDEQTAPERDA